MAESTEIPLLSFNTGAFVVFLIGLWIIHRVLPTSFKKIFLLICSYAFYAACDTWFVSLLLFSTGLDFFCGQRIYVSSPKFKKVWLSLSLLGNLGLLFVFKYFEFFYEQIFRCIRLIGLGQFESTLEIALPLGISFYTFQTMSYSIDIYRGQLKPCKRWLDFALFVSWFPQLLAGPIERATHFLPQIQKSERPSRDQYIGGLWLILLGYFKKLVIAGHAYEISKFAFTAPSDVDSATMLLALYANAFFIYADFSGYSDIARGISRLFGYELVLNFNIPFFARNIQDFWARWHMSLTQWLRDYLYEPLMRTGPFRGQTKICIFITLLIIGIWHGAGWTFVVFGIWHGLWLVLFEATRKWRRTFKKQWGKLWSIAGWFLTFHIAILGLAIFQVISLRKFVDQLETLIAFQGIAQFDWIPLIHLVYYIAPLILLQLYKEKKGQDPWREWSGPVRLALFGTFALFILMHYAVVGGTFVYFQF